MSETNATGPLFVQPASEVTACPLDWLWPGRLALGKLSILDGDPGQGKSLIALDLCARLSTGRPLPDNSAGVGPAPALFINGEDRSEDTTVPRLQASGADLQRVYVLRASMQDAGPTFRIPSQLRLLHEALTQTHARLAVIDPLMAFLDPSVQVASDLSVRAALDPVARLAVRHGCAILFLRHLNKTLRLRALYRGGGSIGIAGACRSAWVVGSDPQEPDRHILAQLKNNLAAPQPSLIYQLVRHEGRPPELLWLGTSNRAADTLLTPPRLSARAERTLRAAKFLQTFLAAGPRLSSEIWAAAQKEGFARRTLQRAMKRCGIHTRHVRINEVPRSYWLLEGQTLPPEIGDPFGLEAYLEPIRQQYPGPTPIDDL